MCEVNGVIAIDTNVLVRLLVADNPTQFRASLRLFESNNIFIADSVILETEWVLRAAYDLSAPDVCHALRKTFGLPGVSLVNARRTAQIIDWHEAGMDFADAFHLALSASHESMKTFDVDFIKQARKLTTYIVEKP
jgi:predicted nucleic-acid-binding protein